MKYLKKQTKPKKNIYFYLLVGFIIAFCFFNRGIIYRSLVTINLGSLYVDLLSFKADVKNLFYNNSIDQISISISPNNYVKLQQERSKMTSNYILTGSQWSSKNEYFKADIRTKWGKSKSKIKLFGMNPDHYRDSDGHSFRVMFNGSTSFGNKKVNFINPRSRDYMTDILANLLYFKISDGVKLNYEFVKIIFNKKDYGYYLKEDFFDKYLIEENNRRESVIFEIYKDSLQFNHIGDDKEFLSLSNELENIYENEYKNFLRLVDVEKLKGILLISLILNDYHPIRDLNLHWIHNPVTGMIEPTFREGFVYEIENLNLDQLTFPGIVNDIYEQHIKRDFPQYIKKNLPQIRKFINSDKEYLTFKEKMSGYEYHINFRENIIINNISILEDALKEKKIKYPELKEKIITIKNDTLINKDWIIKENEILEIKAGTRIILKDVYLKIRGGLKVLGEKNNRVLIASPKSNPSTIYIQTPNNITINYTDFKYLSNTKSPFKQPAAITFYETKNVRINNCYFQNNLEGDDYLNFFRSKNIEIKNSIIDGSLSDGIDSDFSQVKILNSTIKNSGNDAIDGSGSDIFIENCKFLSSQDKAVSAGEKSEIKILNSYFDKNEIAVVSKDDSHVFLINNSLINNNLDIAVYKKKKIYDHATLYIENTKIQNYLIEKKSIIDGFSDIVFTANVEEKLYGNLYGKSSEK